ncbi:MAG: DNA-binding protein [Bacteroidaceae bacterium]
MINRAVGERMNAFYENIKEKPPKLIRRKEAAVMMGISLPTLDQYSKHGIIRAKHIGGRVFYEETEIIKLKKEKK